MTVPSIEPRPPNRLAPPRTTAVITVRLSVAWPAMVVESKEASARIPASPDSRPDSA